MAVGFDAKSTSPTATTSPTRQTSHSHTNLTVGSGANRGLVFGFAWEDINPGPITACNWDNGGTPQAMTAIVSPTAASDGTYVALYGLVNPTAGNKTLFISWTNSAELIACGIAFTGVDQTGGATTFAHATTNASTGAGSAALPANPTITITSATGNYTVAIAQVGHSAHPTSPTQTSWFGVDGNNANNPAGSYAAGAATVTHAFTISPTNPWIMAGVDIVAAGGGGKASKNTRSAPLGMNQGEAMGIQGEQ